MAKREIKGEWSGYVDGRSTYVGHDCVLVVDDKRIGNKNELDKDSEVINSRQEIVRLASKSNIDGNTFKKEFINSLDKESKEYWHSLDDFKKLLIVREVERK